MHRGSLEILVTVPLRKVHFFFSIHCFFLLFVSLFKLKDIYCWVSQKRVIRAFWSPLMIKSLIVLFWAYFTIHKISNKKWGVQNHFVDILYFFSSNLSIFTIRPFVIINHKCLLLFMQVFHWEHYYSGRSNISFYINILYH